MKHTSYLVPSVMALLLSACAVGPDYHQPIFDFPSWWHSSSKQQDSVVTAKKTTVAWWEAFHDDKLNDLVKRALANNQDLKIAQARVLEARATRETTASAFYPQVSANAGTQNVKEIPFGDQSVILRNYSTTFDASWEIDLFGSTRRAVEGANATIQARDAELRDASISLIGEVVRDYIEWRSLQQEIVLTQDTAKSQKELFDIADQQYKAGTGNYLAASQAQTLYKSTIAHMPELERQREAAGYRLSVLLGEVAGPLNTELKTVKTLPKPIAIPALSAPVDVIRNRPDVQVAERELAAATALHAEAFTDLFPKISLASFFGIDGARIGQAVPTWGVTSALSLPLLNFGRIQGEIKAADARQQQALFNYHRTVLNAISDVETSLTNVAKANASVVSLQDSIKSANQTLSIAQDRYKSGLSNFTDVLDAQQQLYSARTNLVMQQAALLTYITALHKALAIQ